MHFAIVPAFEISLAEQAEVANEAFAGYIAGWSELNAETLARFLMLQGADLFYSRFIRVDDRLAGFGYINRTGDVLRLGAMALIPEARGTGAAVHLIDHLCDEAKQRGDAAMVLEVIEQNPRAHAAYRRHGFRELMRLCGWRRPAQNGAPQPRAQIEEIPILHALGLPGLRDYPEVPWSISPHAIAKVERTRAFHLDGVSIVTSEPATSSTRVHGLFSANLSGPEIESALTQVLQQFPDREFFALPVFPEKFSASFEKAGFVREPLSQFLMRRDF